jgi:hypothetical protein
MTHAPNPAGAGLDISAQLQFQEATYEHALLKSLMARAPAEGDRTFSIMREALVSIRRGPEAFLDRLAGCEAWWALRPDIATLIVRSEGLFGILGARGTPDMCRVSVQLWADTTDRADAALARVLEEIGPYRIMDIAYSLNWRFINGRGQVTRVCTEERVSEPLLDEAYPVLGGVEEFIGQYLAAPESVLVLQGAPGTGKTRLIRAILAAIGAARNEPAEVLYSGDSAVLESDDVFLEFIVGDFQAFVVEDADHLLAPRCDGNQTLHRFLNIADGIASARGRKIIFSTNLPNVRDIDEALVRPGRCFAHLYLEELQPEEAVNLLERLCEGTPERRAGALAQLDQAGRKAFSVAEVYSAVRHADPQSVQTGVRQPGLARAAERMAFGFN